MLNMIVDTDSNRIDNTAPSRYAGYGKHNIECIEAMEYICDNFTGKQSVAISQIIKYIWRCNEKDGYRDLDKAIDYLNRLIGEWD